MGLGVPEGVNRKSRRRGQSGIPETEITRGFSYWVMTRSRY